LEEYVTCDENTEEIANLIEITVLEDHLKNVEPLWSDKQKARKKEIDNLKTNAVELENKCYLA